MNKSLPARPMLWVLPWLMFVSALQADEESCPPQPYSKPELLELRAGGFQLDADESRNALAMDLLACVGDPDPELRDGIAFEAISTWLRAGQLAPETYQVLYRGLVEQLQAEPDSKGFRQPFAALILSEVARVDRLTPQLSEEQRKALVQVAAEYLVSVTDYRGFSESEGWRHGVAHGSDLVLQLALNPQVDASQISLMMTSIASQVAPGGEVFYVYGEPSRLVRAVFYAYRREVLPEEYWQEWIRGISAPGPMPSWRDAFASNSGLAKRHNTLAFLADLYLSSKAADDDPGEKMSALALSAIRDVTQ